MLGSVLALFLGAAHVVRAVPDAQVVFTPAPAITEIAVISSAYEQHSVEDDIFAPRRTRSDPVVVPAGQIVFAPVPEVTDIPEAQQTPVSNVYRDHHIDEAIIAAVKEHADPVAAILSLDADLEAVLGQPRLLHVLGELQPTWMTEGDKLRLRRKGRKFVDITAHEEFYAQQAQEASYAHPSRSDLRNTRASSLTPRITDLPDLTHDNLIFPLFPKIETQKMHDVLKHMTSYYNRYYGGIHGALSSEWLHDHIAQVFPSSEPFSG